MITFYYSNNGGHESLSVMLNGELKTVSSNHPNFTTIRDDLMHDPNATEEEINGLYDVKASLTRLTDRITVIDGSLHYDGDKIDNALSRHILGLMKVGDVGYKAFANFMEKLAQNPSPLSRIHLYKWVSQNDLVVTPEGDIVTYKGVQDTEDNLSVSSGDNTVYVNDVPHTGHVPNPVGATVHISRGEVDPDREKLCSTGLHVGHWSYASGFGSATIKVLVNPRDVVAVPKDHEDTKMRVARYVVVERIEQEIKEAIHYIAYPDDDIDFDYESWDSTFFDDDFDEIDLDYDDPYNDDHPEDW